jgi:hypothetical protein
VRARAHARVEVQTIAAHDAARRMQDVDVTDARALGKKWALHGERPLVAPMREHARAADVLEPELERRAPPARVGVCVKSC